MDAIPVVLSEFFGELLGVGGKELLFLFNVTGDLEGLDIGQEAF